MKGAVEQAKVCLGRVVLCELWCGGYLEDDFWEFEELVRENVSGSGISKRLVVV